MKNSLKEWFLWTLWNLIGIFWKLKLWWNNNNSFQDMKTLYLLLMEIISTHFYTEKLNNKFIMLWISFLFKLMELKKYLNTWTIKRKREIFILCLTQVILKWKKKISINGRIKFVLFLLKYYNSSSMMTIDFAFLNFQKRLKLFVT